MAILSGRRRHACKASQRPTSAADFPRTHLQRRRDAAEPNRFRDKHPSDNATYAEVKRLLTKEVVAIPKSRAADDALVNLQDAYGSNHGPLVIGKIKTAKKIIFHACGDSGASEGAQIPQRAESLRSGDDRLRPVGRSQSPGLPLPSRRRGLQFRRVNNIITTSFTTHSATTPPRSSRFRATTIHSSFPIRRTIKNLSRYSSAIFAPSIGSSRTRRDRFTAPQ